VRWSSINSYTLPLPLPLQCTSEASSHLAFDEWNVIIITQRKHRSVMTHTKNICTQSQETNNTDQLRLITIRG